jgi:uncharacterized Zn ribbon protein
MATNKARKGRQHSNDVAVTKENRVDPRNLLMETTAQALASLTEITPQAAERQVAETLRELEGTPHAAAVTNYFNRMAAKGKSKFYDQIVLHACSLAEANDDAAQVDVPAPEPPAPAAEAQPEPEPVPEVEPEPEVVDVAEDPALDTQPAPEPIETFTVEPVDKPVVAFDVIDASRYSKAVQTADQPRPRPETAAEVYAELKKGEANKANAAAPSPKAKTPKSQAQDAGTVVDVNGVTLQVGDTIEFIELHLPYITERVKDGGIITKINRKGGVDITREGLKRPLYIPGNIVPQFARKVEPAATK